jgi:hypothetical protein
MRAGNALDRALLAEIRTTCTRYRTALIGGYVEVGSDGVSLRLAAGCHASGETYPKAHVFATEATVLVCFEVEFPETAGTLAVPPPVDCTRPPDVKEWR